MANLLGEQFGNYRLVRLLGTGGFAEVYLSEHVFLQTPAAIKILDTRLGKEDQDDFLQEARTIARLKHPHIIRLLEFGIEGGTPYLVMDYAPNGTLRQRHPRRQAVPHATISAYAGQVADALHYAHTQRLVHRDIKPENMLLDEQNTVLLSDFGIAVVTHTSRSSQTETIAGTAIYMAPEQFQGKPHPASDQYALGIVVYEWLTGAPPFQGTFPELYGQHLHIPAPPLRERLPTIPPGIEAVVLKALAKDPVHRFASVRDFAAAFKEACHHAEVYFAPTAVRWPADQESRRMSSGPGAVIEPVLPIPQTQPEPSTLPVASPLVTDFQVSPSGGLPISEKITPDLGLLGIPESAPRFPLDPTMEERPNAYQPQVADRLSPSMKPHPPISRRKLVIGLAGIAVAGGGVTLGLGLLGQDTRPLSRPTTRETAATSPSPTATATQTVLPPGNILWSFHGHKGFIRSVAWSPNGSLIASASDDRTAQIWAPFDLASPIVYKGHHREVMSVAWSPDGASLATGSQDQTVQVWDRSGTTLWQYSHGNWVFGVAWSPNGNFLASASWDGTVQVWDARARGHVRTYFGHPDAVACLAWSPDSAYIASGDLTAQVHVWEAVSGKKVFSYQQDAEQNASVTSVAWSSNGSNLASVGEGQNDTLQLWEVTTWTQLTTDALGPSYHVEWAKKSTHIAAATGSGMTIWDAQNHTPLYTFSQTGYIYTFGWSPDGHVIASGGQDQIVTVWEAV